MKDQDVIYSRRRNDEFYTPPEGVTPILPYIPSDKIVWCPFDKANESNYVKLISKQNLVVSSHISEPDHDFFSYEPEHWDILISNPPFGGKRQIFERALSFRKPFGLLMTLTWLNDSAPKQLFKQRDLQLLMLEKRLNFTNEMGIQEKKVTFSSAYYCWNLLPKQIIMK